jgi:hypothetical protein
MSFSLFDNVKVTTGKPLDAKYLKANNLPYADINEVNAEIPLSQRYIGLTVNIASVEYWYANGVTDDDLIPKAGGGGGGEANNGSNVGSGYKIFKQKSGLNLQFRTLSGGTHITFVSGDTLGIHTTGLLSISSFNTYSGSTLTNINSRLLTSAFNTYSGGTRQNILNASVTGATNLGTTGDALFTSKTGRNLQFKRLVAGTNVTLTPSSTGITISSTGGGGGGSFWKTTGSTTVTTPTIIGDVTTQGILTVTSSILGRSHVQVGSQLRDNRQNPLLTQSLSGVTSNRTLSLSNATYLENYLLGTGWAIGKTSGLTSNTRLDIRGIGTTSSSKSLKITNLTGNTILEISDDSLISVKRVEYTSNFSSQFVKHSLVDKNYVTGHTSSFVSGATNLGTTGEILFTSKSGRNLQFKRLVAGGGVNLTSTSTGITITSTGGGEGGGEVNTASNIGIGYKIFKRKNIFDFEFRTVSGGTHISFVSGDTLGIHTTGLLATSSFNTYSGTTVPNSYYNKTQINAYSAATLTNINSRLLTTAFNTYSGGTRQNILNSAVTGGTNLGTTGEILFTSKSGRNLQFKRLVAGTNINLTASSTGITITSTGGGEGGGEVNTASNIGIGYKIFKRKNVFDLEFRTVSGGTHISFVSGDTLGIHTTGLLATSAFNTYSGATLTNINSRLLTSAFNTYSGGTRQNILNAAVTGGTNLGTTGDAIFSAKNGRNLEFKKLAAGSNISLASTSTGVTIATTGLITSAQVSFYTGSTAPNTYYNKSQINFYTGSTVPNTYYSKSQINFYTGSTAPNTFLTKSAFSTYSGGTRQNILNSAVTGATNLGTTGNALYDSKNGRDLQFKRLVAGANITLSSSATGVTISTGGSSGEANTASNIGTGYKIFKRKDNVNLEFRTLSGGTHISFVSGDTLGIHTTGLLATSDFNTYSGTSVPNTYYNKTQINFYTGSTAPNTYYNKNQINFYTGSTAPNTFLTKTAFDGYSGGTRQNILNSAVTGATNLGTTGNALFDSKSGRNLQFKKLAAGTNISLTSTSTGVTISTNGVATISSLNFYTGSTAPNTYYNKSQINFYTGSTVPNTYYAKSQINFYTGSTAPNTFLSKSAFNTYSGGTRQDILNSAVTGATNLGTTGDALFTSKSGRNLQFKKLAAGANISLSSTATGVTINTTGLVTTANLNFYTGSTAPNTYLTKTAFNTYSGGTRQNILNTAVTGGTNLGTTGNAIFSVKNGRNLEFKKLAAGTNISLANTSTGVTISTSGLVSTASLDFYTGSTAPNTYLSKTAFNTYSGGTRQNILNSAVTGATNLGTTGNALFDSKSGRNLQFKKLAAGSNIALTSTSTGVTIATTGLITSAQVSFYTGSTAPNTYYNKTQINFYSGSSVPNTYYNKTQINFYTGSTANNLYLTKTAFNTYSGGTRQNILNAAVTGATNLGAGSALFTSKSGRNLQFKTVTGNTNITLVNGTNSLGVNVTGVLQSTAFSGLAKITVSTTAPSSPAVGDLWVDTN